MRFLKVGAVIVGALVISTLGISATDTLKGNSGSLLGQLISTEEAVCPSDMVHVPTAQSFTCIDRYEASPTVLCPHAVLSAGSETQENLNEVDCNVEAVADADPWTYVTREQAATLCARSGKRLPTAAEWYAVAIGTPDTTATCNTASNNAAKTGSFTQCMSAVDVYDAVGNVWEWVSDDIHGGEHVEELLPTEGYVHQVNSAGIATETKQQPSELFYADYLWSEAAGTYGMLRGGYYASKDDGGVYAVQAKTVPTSATVAIGFRCVR